MIKHNNANSRDDYNELGADFDFPFSKFVSFDAFDRELQRN